MWYLYLDESGDLGFDFVNKNHQNFYDNDFSRTRRK